jgi:hypothetical protein
MGMGLPSLGSSAKGKSARSAMWLSLTWPGSGHLYAGITEKGAILCGISVVLFALSLTLIGPVLGLVLWLGLALYTAIDVSSTLTR